MDHNNNKNCGQSLNTVIVHNRRYCYYPQFGANRSNKRNNNKKAKYSELKQQKTKGFSSEQKQQNNKKQNISHFNKKHKKAKDVS